MNEVLTAVERKVLTARQIALDLPMNAFSNMSTYEQNLKELIEL